MTPDIRVLTHSAVRIVAGVGILYVDPYGLKDAPRDADFVFVTHEHYDHFSPDDIAAVRKDSAVLIVPENMFEKARAAMPEGCGIVPVKPGFSYEVGGIAFETVPAYNRLKPFHPKSAGWVGYVFLLDGCRVYVAGDTDATSDARAVRCDVALVPVGGTYTMNASQAAGLVNDIRPALAIPTHYGSVVGSAADAEAFRKAVDPSVRVEILMEG